MVNLRSASSGSLPLFRNICFFCFPILLLGSDTAVFAQQPSTSQNESIQKVSITQQQEKLKVSIDGKPFTEYRYRGLRKPILFPIMGPGQVPMTRSYPMVAEVKNESNDHPHHQSLWFTHGKVNGTDFWISSDKRKGTKARIRTDKVRFEKNWILSLNSWLDEDGKVVCKDSRKMTFGSLETGTRFIDFEIELFSDNHRVIFGDTKEGTMAIRVHPMLRLTPDKKRGTTKVSGKAINSNGISGRKIWGKRAKWVAYWGKVQQKDVGVAIFDHNKNLRHPTWWHARHYGLVGANPFGIHDFERKEKGAGDYVLDQGKKLKLKYRFLFFEGKADSKKIEKSYLQFVNKN